MTPDEIRGHLAKKWLDQRDRRRLQAQLDRAAAPAAARATPRDVRHHASATVSPPASRANNSGDSFEHIAIKGPPAFVSATKASLAKLRQTSSWSMVSQIRTISAARGSNVLGWCSGNDVHVDEKIWRGNTAYLPGLIAHEACHAANRDAVSTPENESRAYASQARALREIGASRSLIADAERNSASPPHFKPGFPTTIVLGSPATDAGASRTFTVGRVLITILFGS
jgi:hypothetical protein